MSCEVSTPTCVVKCPKHLLAKLHVQPKPNCNFLYTNCKIGNSLWKTSQPNDFTFADPLMRETPTEYNSLHDPNLRTFFMRKARLDHLRSNNFITSRNEVICSLKDVNDYRKYLHRMRAENGAIEARQANVSDLDCNRLKVSSRLFAKIYKENKKFREMYQESSRCATEANPLKYESVLETMKRRKLEQECQRKMKFMSDIEKYNQRLNEIQQHQNQKRRELMERAAFRNHEIAKKQIFVEEKLRKHQLKIKKEIIAQDKLHQKMVRKLKRQPKKVDMIVRCPLEM